MSGPLTQVLDAFAAGAASLADVEARTGLGRPVVAASVDHLVRLGRLTAEPLAAGCPGGGCGSCPVVATAGGCGRRAPGLVALRRTIAG